MAYTRICVAAALQRYVDSTPIAERLRDLAGVLARGYDLPVTVLSVKAPVPLLPDVETLEEKLERFAAPLRESGARVSTALREGRPSRAISAFAKDSDTDLLVIGSHSKRGPLDVGIGSTAAPLVRDLGITVLTVSPTAADQERARELMIPRYPLVFPYA